MAKELGIIIADFQTSLAGKIAIGGVSGSLLSATDDDGVILPDGRYFFTIDSDNSSKEHISCDLVGTTKAITNIKTVARGTGVETVGTLREHRIGATVTITDFAHIKKINNLLDGTTDLDSDTPLKYDADPTITDDKHLATKKYADDLAIAGSPDASSTVKGIAKLSTDPASPTEPIAVGDNDARVPPIDTSTMTSGQVAGLAGTGVPSGSNKYVTEDYRQFSPTGMISPFAGIAAPTGWLLCNGATVSRTTYAALFNLLNPTLGTVTISIASPGEVTFNTHGLATGDSIYLTTNGGLPTGLSINTRYWVIKKDANVFYLASSQANALAGTKINTSVSQSGVHTANICSFGVGNGSTTFTLPNLLGAVIVGKNQSEVEFAGLGETGGEKTHALIETEMPAHSHKGMNANANTSGPYSGFGAGNTFSLNGGYYGQTDTKGSGAAHNNLQPYITLNYIIKY